ncbi:Glycerol-3-phosphate acyltransferase [Scenedesmus sp. PABB004]|nr:Glycerol-3-phosphate acyltransferase [Scenedesmus sp. PABB004]
MAASLASSGRPALAVRAARPGRSARVAVRAAAPAAAPSASAKAVDLSDIQFINPMWGQPRTEKEFLGIITKMVEAGKLPPKLQAGWVDFYGNYRAAVESSGVDSPELVATKVQCTIADCVFNQFVDPYTFPSAHSRLLEPYNYYAFGQRYVGSLIDFDNSVLGHARRWDAVAEQLAAGHNVVLLANHQTEADPGVFAHMLSASHPGLATDVIYVAGDRVVTDALCKPFSMGRNLFCVHSKKHLGDVPELKAAKMETNRKTLVAMQRAFNKGGTLVWIAPSGGRDRPKGDVWSPDAFDAAAVELMRNLVNRAKQPGHLYPMAMFSYPVMPPPKTVDKELGERRLTAWSGVGISLCEELDVPAVVEGLDDKDAAQAALAHAAWSAVCDEYARLDAAITHPDKRAAMPEFTQPFLAPKAA